jgi:trk system potassium uptake protein TrkH
MRDRFRTVLAVLHALGGLLMALAAPLAVPALVGLGNGEAPADVALGFGLPAAATLVAGWSLRHRIARRELGETEALLVCGLAWAGLSLFGAIPLIVVADMSILDAWFEAISGFTTTGITLLTGLDELPASILLWRALTQWIGGLGILTLFFTLVQKRPGLHRLVRAESHKISTKQPVPNVERTLRILWAIYAGLTVAVMLALVGCGLTVFDAITHAFTTVSTGGFSTHDASIAYFASPAVDYVLIVGMTLSGVSFLVHYRVLKGQIGALWDRPEVRWWWLLLAALLVIVFWECTRIGSSAGVPEERLRTSWFQVTAILTTTGYATQDIGSNYFGVAAKQLFLLMMIIGGCSGSTGGGFKVIRIVLLGKMLSRLLFRLSAPRGARSSVIYGGELVEDRELSRVSALFFAWLALLVIGGVITALLSEHGPLAAISGMFSALGNIGPCYIPGSEMSELHGAIKGTYMVGMLAGRLEILPVFLLFSRRAWGL